MNGTALFGGTFDPVHNGHVEIARAAADRFGIGRILFIPAAHPPHKPDGVVASWEDRFRMVELACAADPRFEASRIEAGGERSYSIVTIEKLARPGMGKPGFLIGADAFAEIDSWYRFEDVIASVEFIVVTRPGAKWATPRGAIVHELHGLDIPISSSAIREDLLQRGVHVPVPDLVFAYIRERGLYGHR